MDAPMNPNIHAGGSVPRSGKTGFVVATLILLAVIIAGGVYFWQARADKSLESNSDISSIEEQSSSDEAAAIEADLNATNVDSVDYDLSEENFTAS
jgi:hypothetical protein